MAAEITPKDALPWGVKYTENRFRLLATHELEAARVRDAIVNGKVRGSHFRAMRMALNLTIDDVTDVLGVSARTINRKERGRSTLSPAEADRAYRLARVADLAVELIGDAQRASSWLRAPSTYLGDKTPVQMLDTEVGTDLVVESLYAIAFGGVA